jgi:hypothetical protein
VNEPPHALPPPTVCPLCGGDNACGMAAGDASCWCFTASIPAAALDAVAEAARDQRCICAGCAGRMGADPGPTTAS